MVKKFSGTKVTIGCVIYLFCMMGYISSYASGYALMPEAYGVDVALLGTSVSVCAALGFLSSMAYATLDSKIHARGLLMVGVVTTLITGLEFKFLSGFIGLCILFACMGVLNGLTTYTVITEILSAWFVDKRADKIAMSIAGGAFGMAAYQFVAGYVFTAFGIRNGYLLLSVVTAVIILICSRVLVVANTPEEVGQKALGAENVQAADAQAAAQDVGSASNLYKNPTFWYGSIARILGSSAVMFVTQYATMLFGDGGISLAVAGTLISVMNLCSALFALISGRVLGALKVKRFLALVMACAALANAGMLMFGLTHSIVFIVLVIAFFTIGNSAASVNNLVVDKMFRPADVPNANSKFYAMMFAGNIVWLILSGVLVQALGFIVFFTVIAALNVLSMVFYFIALASAKKQGIQQ